MNLFMQRALELARQAEQHNEVPVGAVIVFENEIIAEGFNQPIVTNDPTAHAEIIALRAAGQALANYRLNNCDLYVTLEPCAMCATAIIHARINQLFYAASDPKSGCIDSCMQLFTSDFINHRVSSSAGLMAKESSELLKKFFKARR